MSAPPGFNPNDSMLPDPGANAVPIHVMRGGGNVAGGNFTKEELEILQLYELGPGGTIKDEISDEIKRAFLKQIQSGVCEMGTGNSVILNKDCWAVVEVIRALINGGLKNGKEIELPLKPIKEPAVEPVAEPAVEPVAEPAVEPVAEPVAEPAVEPIAEPLNTNIQEKAEKEYENILREIKPVQLKNHPLLAGKYEEVSQYKKNLQNLMEKMKESDVNTYEEAQTKVADIKSKLQDIKEKIKEIKTMSGGGGDEDIENAILDAEKLIKELNLQGGSKKYKLTRRKRSKGKTKKSKRHVRK